MAQQLSEAGLREWMHKLGPSLIALSAGICRDRHRAEEIVQEAFVKLWQKPPDAGEVAFSSWLRRVVTNLSINALQRTKRPGALPEFSTDPALQARERRQSHQEDADELSRMARAMDRLDDTKRAILLLRAKEQLTYEQIAEHLDVPVGTVMSRLNRARAALMDALEAEVAEDANDESAVYEFRRYKRG